MDASSDLELPDVPEQPGVGAGFAGRDHSRALQGPKSSLAGDWLLGLC